MRAAGAAAGPRHRTCRRATAQSAEARAGAPTARDATRAHAPRAVGLPARRDAKTVVRAHMMHSYDMLSDGVTQRIDSSAHPIARDRYSFTHLYASESASVPPDCRTWLAAAATALEARRPLRWRRRRRRRRRHGGCDDAAACVAPMVGMRQTRGQTQAVQRANAPGSRGRLAVQDRRWL